MALSPRVAVLAACGVVALLGLALGAESQVETFLHPDDLESGFADHGSAAGNLVILTALLPATALTVGATLLSRRPPRQRAGPAAGLFVSAFLLVFLVQSSWPSYTAVDVARSASFSISPLVSNGDAVASVFVGPMAILLLAVMGTAATGRALLRSPGPPADAATLARRHMGIHLLAVPFLVVLAAGSLRLMTALPSNDPTAAPYLFILPVVALAALGLVVTGCVKVWHLAAFARDARLADVAAEAWGGLRRADWVLAGVIATAALVAFALKPIDLAVLQAGETFGTTTRGHVQAGMLLAVPLLPSLLMDRDVLRLLDGPERARPSAVPLRAGLGLGAWVAAAASALGALVGVFIPGPLWGWMLALVPALVAAWVLLPARHAAPLVFLTAVVLWGIGNTVSGTFQLNENAGADLVLDSQPGVLAMFRVLAVVLVGIVVSRLARDDLPGLRRSVALPLTVGLGAAVALVLVLELPFSAWIASGRGAQFVGIGSVVASQDVAVRAVMHVLSGACAGLAGLAVARIQRPDWFGRPGRPEDAPAPAPSAMPGLPDRSSA